jgi:hypothetical protein
MLKKGFLATGSFYATYAHQDQHIESYLDATQEVFGIVAQALRDNTLMQQLAGPVAHAGFRRLT